MMVSVMMIMMKLMIMIMMTTLVLIRDETVENPRRIWIELLFRRWGNSQKYYRNHLGFQCHPSVGLMDETVRFLLEELRCALHLVQEDLKL